MDFFSKPFIPQGLRLLAGLMLVAGAQQTWADPVITEFMASNKTTLADEDAEFSDWIEVHNPDASSVNMAGWSLTDDSSHKTKWRFPEITLPGSGYIVVFASGKDRADPAKPLHTNFSLSADGEYLAVVRPDETTATTEFSPAFEAQAADVSYGITQPDAGVEPQWGHFSKATPAKKNGDASALTLVSKVVLSVPSGIFVGTPELRLSGAGEHEKIRYVIAEPSVAGAAVDDPSATSPEYTAPIPLDRAYVLRAAVFSADNARRGKVTHAHYLPLAASGPARLDTFNSSLPITILDVLGFGALVKDDVDHPAWFYGFDRKSDGLAQISAASDFASPMVMTVRGSTSAAFPKKSYKFELQTAAGKKAPLPLFGLSSFPEWNLVGPWGFDSSYIRNAVGYALSNRLGRWAARTQLTEVFFNHDGGSLDASDYAGVYVLTDKIEADPERIPVAQVTAADLDPVAITGGYLLRVDAPDPEKTSWRTARNFPSGSGSVLMVESPKTAKLAAAQAQYIKSYVQQFEDAVHADYQSGWRTRAYLDFIDRGAWVDHHLLNTFFKNVDAFWRSSYYSKDRGGKLVAGPIWDLDRAMGSTDERSLGADSWDPREVPNLGYTIHYWEFGWWGVLALDPDFRQAWIDRWQTLRRSTLSDTSLIALIDQLSGEIGLEAAARDRQKWPDGTRRFELYAEEIAHLKNWMIRRARWIDAQFVPAPQIAATANEVTLTPAAGTQIHYTLDGTDPRGADGQPAPGTIQTGESVTVPRNATLAARAYRSEGIEFPGTPWSALAPRGSDVEPASRLANLSARANAGSGDEIVIAGVVVRSPRPKRFLVRAAGPALRSLGLTESLPDPVLRVMDSAGNERHRNRGWLTGPDPTAVASVAGVVGAFAFAEDSDDSALLVELSPGPQTLSMFSESRLSGTGLIELYETDDDGAAVNLSARAAVRPDRPLIGGFVISGRSPKRILVRAVGPALEGQGVVSALANPRLTLHAGPNPIAANDDWGIGENSAGVVEEASRLGAFALTEGSRDAALLLTVSPGIYTAVVTSSDGGEGVALVEIYDAD